MQPEGNVEIRLKELDGVMCGVQLSYQAKRQGDGAEETYEVEEDFTLKWNELRIYMMQYDRTVNQIFAAIAVSIPESVSCLASRRMTA